MSHRHRRRWIQCPKTGELIPEEEYYRPAEPLYAIHQDTMKPLWHPVEDRVTDSKTEWYSWNRKHGLIEVGNETVRGTHDRWKKEQEAKRDKRREAIIGQTIADFFA